MGYKIENHPVSLRFLGAVDGQVVPSGTVMSVQSSVKEKAHRTLIDVGSAIRDETPEGRNMQNLEMPRDLDAIVISHSHTDHCGALPEAVSKNPTAKVFAPEGNKPLISIIAHEALKRAQGRDLITQIREWRNELIKMVKRITSIEEELAGGVKRGRKGRTEKTTKHKDKNAHLRSLEYELEKLEGIISSALGINQYSILSFLELIGKKVQNPGSYEITEGDLMLAVDIVWKQKLEKCAEQGIMSATDVDKATEKITELKLDTQHKIGKFLQGGHNRDITIKMKESGHTHTVPSAQVFFEVPVKNGKKIGVLFSGDRGSGQLKPPYSQADDKGLEGKADVLVLECTYGDRVHKNREEALQKLDRLVSDAIEKGEDIVFPIISLDKPMMVMYEIVTRLLNKNPKLAEKVDISYFGIMLGRILTLAKVRKHPMEKEIHKFWTSFLDNQKRSLEKKGKKSRFIFAGGGFVPKNGSPAGAVLEFALAQPDMNIFIPNYHGGPGSNAHNLINGEEFMLTKENPFPRKLEKGQTGRYIEGFSGHEDGPGLVNYARKVMKEGGTIYLNHGSEGARQGLYLLLTQDPIIKRKNIKVILPTANQDYQISTTRYSPDNRTPPQWKQKEKMPPRSIFARLGTRRILQGHQRRFSRSDRNGA